MMESREILEFIAKDKGITISEMSRLMGLRRAQPLYDIRDGKVKSISDNYAKKILAAFPEYSIIWLRTGEGKPYNEYNVGIKDSIPEKIYHYTTLKGLLGILSSSKILFSDFSNSDDFREREFADNDMKYICFCHGEDAGNKPAMWSKYASNNTGVCLCINMDKLIEKNKGKGEFEHFPISYVGSRFIRTGQDECSFFKFKQENWSFQNEYRFISSKLNYLIIDDTCIEGITFGEKRENDISEEAIDLASKGGFVNLKFVVRGEYVSTEIKSEKHLSWNDVRLRAEELYEKVLAEDGLMFNNNLENEQDDTADMMNSAADELKIQFERIKTLEGIIKLKDDEIKRLKETIIKEKTA